MKQWIGSAVSVAIVGLVFLAVGYKLGEVRAQASSERFVVVSGNEAVDRYTGTKCTTEHTTPPQGVTLYVPECAALLSKR